jgi:hypothetical protein
MRAVPGRLSTLRSTGSSRREYGWRQAGSSSFAYRLAHLSLPRGVASFGLILTFYLF